MRSQASKNRNDAPCYDLRWKARRDRAQSFVLTLTLKSNILTETFILVSCSNTFQNLLWLVHGQGQKC